MIVHSGTTLLATNLHRPIIAEPPPLRMVVAEFFGVHGTRVITGATGGQRLSCQATLSGYPTAAALQERLDFLDQQIEQLTGTLTVETTSTRTFTHCIFLGFFPDDRGPFLDGSGLNGWITRGTFHWFKRIRN